MARESIDGEEVHVMAERPPTCTDLCPNWTSIDAGTMTALYNSRIAAGDSRVAAVRFVRAMYPRAAFESWLSSEWRIENAVPMKRERSSTDELCAAEAENVEMCMHLKLIFEQFGVHPSVTTKLARAGVVHCHTMIVGTWEKQFGRWGCKKPLWDSVKSLCTPKRCNGCGLAVWFSRRSMACNAHLPPCDGCDPCGYSGN